MSDEAVRTKSLLELFTEIQPREKSGARTSGRYDFQKDWAICRLLELHLSGKDYVVVLDYHDDVAILNSATTPTEVTFYQIKTKQTGRWTVHALTAVGGDADEEEDDSTGQSILAKLYYNRAQFGAFTKSVIFVSNAHFSIVNVSPTADGQPTCLTCLEEADAQKVKEAIRTQLSLGQEHPAVDCIFVMITSLSLADHQDHTLGKVAKFLGKAFPGQKYLAEPVYQVLFTEVARRTSAEKLGQANSGVLSTKGICRADTTALLDTLGSSIDFHRGWDTIKQLVIRDHWAARDVIALEGNWRQCEIDRMFQVSHIPFLRLQQQAQLFASSHSDEADLRVYLSTGEHFIKTSCSDEFEAYGDNYVRALLLLELYAIWQSAPSSSKPAKEKP